MATRAGGRRAARRWTVVVLATVSMLAMPTVAHAAPKGKTAPLLFAVQGSGGTFAQGSGVATLTLNGVKGQATWFTDRPNRQAGTASISAALEMIGFGTNPPNGVMTVSLADPRHDALAVKLEAPRYDESAGTLVFDATPLERPGSQLRSYAPRLDDSLDASFGEFALFIDDTNTPVNNDGEPVLADAAPVASPEDVAGTRSAPPPNLDCDPGRARSNQCLGVTLDYTIDLPQWTQYKFEYIPGPNCTAFEKNIGPYSTGPRPTHVVDLWLIYARQDGSCGYERSTAHYKVSTGNCVPDCRTFNGPSRVINIEELNIVEGLYTVYCEAGTLPCSGTYGSKDSQGVPTAIVKLG